MGNWLRLASAIVLAGFVAVFLLAPAMFQAVAHYAAAIMIFAVIGVVVFINAYLVSNQDEQKPRTRERYRRCYRIIGWMMVGSVLGALVFATVGWLSDIHGRTWDIPLFALETALLVEFAAFWGFQTVELWNHADRNSLISDEQQATLAPL